MLTRNPAVNRPATVFRGWLRPSTVRFTCRSMACREIGQDTDFVDRQVSPASSAAPVDSSSALQRPSKAISPRSPPSLVPVLSFIGAAVNYSRAVQARTSLQVALDSIIPFSKDVNVGTTNVRASINWTEWEAEPPILANNKSSAFRHRTRSRTSWRRFPSRGSRSHSRPHPQTKSPARSGRAFDSRSALSGSVRGRGELRHDGLDRLERLLGEIAVEAGDLLRFRNEGLVGGTGKIGLRFHRLV
jgi:hypothetical protein